MAYPIFWNATYRNSQCRRRNHKPKPKRNIRRLSLEALELRRLLAAEITTISYDSFAAKPHLKPSLISPPLNKGLPLLPPSLFATVDFQLFDGVTAPALPAGWTSTTTNSNNWTTVSGGSDTAPNHAFVADINTVSDNRLTSPIYAVTASNGRVSFRHSYDTETNFDGGILEISIAGGVFTNITVAGGAFISGGYNGPIETGSESPIEGSEAWHGNSQGYITTVVDVPTSAFGQNIQWRWRFATDQSVNGVGWRIDTIRLSDIPNPPTLDFGDAPATYPVTLAENGARHTVGALRLGPLADAEADGSHSSNATSDGADEDGVVFQTGIDPGQTESIVVTASQAGGFLNAWFDFNADGDWNDAGEKVFSGVALVSGANSLSVSVPPSAVVGPSFARFRVSTTEVLDTTGATANGEVEDYRLDVGQKRFVWVNRGLASDRFDETFGASAALARGVVDAVFASWERVITNLNHTLFGGPGIINITVSMAATGTGFGASASASFQSGFPTSGTVTVGRGNDTNSDGKGDGGGFFLDPTPMDHSEFQGDPTRGAFLGVATSGGPAAGKSDLFSLVNAEITHSLGLFSTPARVNNPLNGTITNTGVIDNSEGGGIGTYYVFDGPSVTHLMTSNNGGGGGSSFSSAIHTAGKPGTGTNQPLAFNSAFRGNRNLVGADDAGNAVYSFGERTLVNDVLALIFKDSYNYAIVMPQTFGTTYAFMNEATGTLTVRGGLSNSNDVINVSRQGNEIVVSVNIGNDVAGTGPNGDASDLPAFISRFPAAGITSIVINGGDGNDSITVSPQVGATISINGGTHSTGDSLTFDFAGVSGASLVNNGNGTGTLTSTNRQSITWSNIEVLTPIVSITSSNKVYDRTAYAATASLMGANSPAPTVSFTYYSDAGGVNAIAAPTNVGTYFVRAVSGTNAGNNTSQSDVTSFQITPAALVASVTANNKPFDNTTAATIASRSLGGILGTDVVTVSGGSATFADAGVGNNKIVTATGLTIGGADAGNYTFNATATTQANITPTVFNRQLFYKGSSYASQSGGTLANPNLAASTDTSKVLARSSNVAQTLNFANNVINSAQGINGIVLDIAGLVGATLTTADFGFRVSPTGAFNEAANPPSGWATAPVPTLITVMSPGTPTTPARVRIEWNNNQIQNQWLQIRVLPTANTGLPSQQTFYLGHLLGEVNGLAVGGASGSLQVTNADINVVRPLIGTNALVTSAADITKNGLVQNSDISPIRSGVGVRQLRLITIPVSGSGSEGTGNGEGSGGGSVPGPAPVVGEPVVLPSWSRSNTFASIADVGLGSSVNGFKASSIWIQPDTMNTASGLQSIFTDSEMKSSSEQADGIVDDLFAELGKESLGQLFAS